MKIVHYIVLLLLEVTNICGFTECQMGTFGENCTDLNLIRRIRAEVTTNQSSIYSPYNNPQDFNSDKAIDGIQNYSVNTCKCCSVTYGNSPSWWQIDLAQKYLIGALQIFGRADLRINRQLEHAVVYAWNISVGSHMTVNMTKIYEIPTITTSQIFTKQLDPIVARFFVVKLFQRVLTLCEFKLFEKVCVIGKFGNGCMRNCHCSDNETCNQITGKCGTPGCLPGWQGDSCETGCGHRTFGDNCSSVCHCLNDSSCDAVSGECDLGRCDPGWRTSSCDKECVIGKFGNGCMRNCHCSDNKTCNQITGNCDTPGCLPGLQGESCGTLINTTMVTTGGNLLNTIKRNIKTEMSSVARNTNSTLAVDGLLGPDPDKCNCCSITSNSPLSWWLLDLGKQYPLSSIIIYGRNKEASYLQLTGFNLLLLNNSIENKQAIYNESLFTTSENIYEILLNNTLARYIKIERPGVLTVCEVKVFEGNCKNGTFGEECSQFCYCADNKPCDQLHGYCQYPICRLGWIGESCNASCPQNTFGEGCDQLCYCEDGTCASDYGDCPGKCKTGYHGAHCNIPFDLKGLAEAEIEHHTSAGIIGGSVAGGVVVIVGLVLLVVFIYKHRIKRIERSESENYYKTISRNMRQHDDETYDTIDISREETQGQVNEGGYDCETSTGL